jgi:hypothetical protein
MSNWRNKLLALGTLSCVAVLASCGGPEAGNQNQSRAAATPSPGRASSNANKSAANSNAPAVAAKPSGGTIQVISTPAGASVILIANDEGGAGTPEPKGSTPAMITGISPGKYVVDVEKPGYKYFQKYVQVKDGQTQKINASLKKE